jgi:hypothetical protein
MDPNEPILAYQKLPHGQSLFKQIFELDLKADFAWIFAKNHNFQTSIQILQTVCLWKANEV